MSKRVLTDLTVSKLPHAATYCVWDASLPSFGLRVGKLRKTWVLKQQNRYHILGRYPMVTLKCAKDEAKRRLALKYFPERSKRTHQAVTEYLEAKLSDHRPASQRVFRIYLKLLDDKPLTDLTPQYVYSILPKTKSAANLSFAVIKAFLSWTVERGYLPLNPLLQRKSPYKKTSRDRLLTDEEVRLIWKESYNHNTFGVIVRLLLLTGQRLSQLTHLQSTWLHDHDIVFPAYIMKSGLEHSLPLTPLMSQHMLQAASSSSPHTTIFPKLNISHSMKVLREALKCPARDLNSQSLKGNTALEAGVYTIPPTGLSHFTLHDFRRYFSSTMAKLKVPIDVTEAILAHTSGSRNPIQRTYDRYDRIEPMRAALTLYEEHLTRITSS